MGWAANIPRLTDWDKDGISIQPNACLCAVAAATALLLRWLGLRRAPAALGALVAFIASATLFQCVSGINFDRFNTLLMFGRTWGRAGVAAPGRMGPPGSVSWMLIGVAVFLSAGAVRAHTRRLVVVLAFVTLFTSLLSLTGYWYGANLLYTSPRFTVIALQTSTFVTTLSLVLILSVPQHAPMKWMLAKGAVGVVARRALPFILLVPLVAGWLRLVGERRGLYDRPFGAALLILLLIGLTLGFMAWILSTISRSEAALRKSEQRMADTLASVRDGVVTLDREWRYVFVNPESERQLGKSSAELLGKIAWELFPEAIEGCVYHELHRAVSERICVEFEDFNPVLQRWFANRAYPTPDGNIAVYFHDVTARKQAEQAAREHEEHLAEDLAVMTRLQQLSTRLSGNQDMAELLREILAAAAEFTGTDKGNIQLYDPVKQLLRIVVHQGLGRRFVEHFAEDGWIATCGTAVRQIERVLVEDIDLLVELRGTPDLEVVRADGIRAIQSTPLCSRDGRLLGMLNNHFRTPGRPNERALRLLDVLARQAADFIERKQAEDSLRDADCRKDEFLATLAHELRNPLAPLVTSLELVRLAEGDAALLADAHARMQRQVSHMTRLVDDLLDLSRIARDKLELRRLRIELQSILRDAVEACRASFAGAHYDLQVLLPPEPMYVDGDPVRLGQVFGNLLNNACKYNEPGGYVALSAELDGSSIVVKVRDGGIGIPTDKLTSIFGMFSQLDRGADKRHGGLGIGLHLVKRLVEMHNGSVEARSPGPGQGSEFVVRLPALLDGSQQSPPHAEAVDAPMKKRRVLVVDDNRDAAESLGALLEVLGNEVQIVHDGATAIARAESSSPDLIVMDIGMPTMSGYDACQAIRQKTSGKQIMMVALTGWGQEDDRRKSQQAGFDAHLIKPVELELLKKLLEA